MGVNLGCFILSLCLMLIVLYYDNINIGKIVIAMLGAVVIQALLIFNKVEGVVCFKYTVLLALLLVAAYTDKREGNILNINLYIAYLSILSFAIIDIVSGAAIKNNLISLFIAFVVTIGLYKIKALGASDIPFICFIAYTFTGYFVLEILAFSIIVFEICNISCTCKNIATIICKTKKRVKRDKLQKQPMAINRVYHIKTFFRYLVDYTRKYSVTYIDPYVPSLFIATLLFVALSRYLYAFTF